jgi:hypothetical protein
MDQLKVLGVYISSCSGRLILGRHDHSLRRTLRTSAILALWFLKETYLLGSVGTKSSFNTES